MSRRETEMQLQSRQRTMQAEAERYGISRRKLELELQKKLDELNLARYVSPGQVADAVAQGQMSIDQLLRERATQLSQNPRARTAQRRLGQVM